MVRFELFSSGYVFQRWGCMTCGPLICHVWTDEEDEENTEDQDEQGNLRGLIDDGDEEEGEEEEESQKSGSGGGSDSEEEVRHRRKKRSKFIRYFLKVDAIVGGLDEVVTCIAFPAVLTGLHYVVQFIPNHLHWVFMISDCGARSSDAAFYHFLDQIL